MDRPEYMRIPFKIIPQEIIEKYKLNDIEENGWVYIKIVKGIYGLPQVGKIAHELLKKETGQVRIPTNTIHPRTTEACVETYQLHPGS